jgi:hypothetical protein
MGEGSASLCALANMANKNIPSTNFHPVLIKNINEGESWSEPEHVQLGGLDGLYEVKYFIPDEIFCVPYPCPDRDSVYYSLENRLDMTVDLGGSPHIVGMVAFSDEEGTFYSNQGVMGTFHIYKQWGNDWYSTHLYNNRTFQGELVLS